MSETIKVLGASLGGSPGLPLADSLSVAAPVKVESTHSEKPWSKTKQSAAISDALMIAEFRGKYI